MIEAMSFSFAEYSDPTALGDDIHLWLLDLTQLTPEIIAKNASHLSQEERERAEKFKHRRNEYMATRTLVRLCLAQYLQVTANEIEFATEAQGKPYLLYPPVNVFFNLSHSGNWVVLALTHQGPIGVDIETPRKRSYLQIAHRYFHQTEVLQLEATSDAEQKNLFLQFWTLKEAFFKALGGGISTGLDKIAFHLSIKPPTFFIAPELQQTESDWRLYHQTIAELGHIAIATKATNSPSVKWLNGLKLFL